MSLPRMLASTVLGASALLACGSSKDSGSAATSGFTGTGGSSSTAAGTGGATTTSGHGGGALGGSSGEGGQSDGGGLFNDLDAAPDATAACMHLNIGIFGNPGSNPSSNFQTWLEMSGTSVQRIQTTSGVPITAATLQPFDVIVLDWLTRDYTPAEAATFSAWVTAGGGVASMSGYSNTPANDWHANTLLAPLEVAYSGPVINGPVTTSRRTPSPRGSPR